MQHFIGIDVGAEKHAVCITDDQGKRLGRFTFDEDAEGYERLKKALPAPEASLVGLEATGHYWRNVFATLVGWGYGVVLINPLVTKRHVEAELSRAKTDRVDAEAIARFLREKRPKPTPLPDEKLVALKELVTWRERIVVDIGANRNALHRLLDLVFPEFPRVVKVLSGPQALYLLEHYPLAVHLAAKDPAELAAEVYDGSRHIGAKTAEALVDKARRTVGKHQNAAYALRIKATVAELRLEQKHLASVNEAIAELLDDDERANLLQSIPGVGPVTAATFLSEVGDVNRFESHRELVAFTGLAPRVHQSGKLTPNSGRMCKVGPPNLRHVLWMAAQVAIQHNTEIAAFYQRLVSHGKPKRAAIGACAAKLVRLMFAVLKRGSAFQLRTTTA